MEEPVQSKSNLTLKVFGSIFIVLILGTYLYSKFSSSVDVLFNPLGEGTIKKELTYLKYTFVKLAERGGIASTITVVEDKFYYYSEGRRISGAINYPSVMGLVDVVDPYTYNYHRYPVVVMARGYAERDGYKTGTGTKNAAAVYAQNGYITLAPDFSGYGESDPEDSYALGGRLAKPVEILDLLASLPQIPEADLSRVYLWGHSNGGQIMLSVAEILGQMDLQGLALKVRGLTLWAPVSKPFPYSILYYTDEASDSGKWLRGQIAQFERDYDVFDYSIDRHLDKINIPILIHQGSNDEAVPKKWSDELAKNLRAMDKKVEYFSYPGADHNMRPGWDSVVLRDVEWFDKLNEEAK